MVAPLLVCLAILSPGIWTISRSFPSFKYFSPLFFKGVKLKLINNPLTLNETNLYSACYLVRSWAFFLFAAEKGNHALYLRASSYTGLLCVAFLILEAR